MPILDLHPRDTDTYITLYNASGQIVMENDDLGNVDTPSGTVNCTFSSLKGLFSVTGVYYVCVRSYYNSIANEDLVLNEITLRQVNMDYIIILKNRKAWMVLPGIRMWNVRQHHQLSYNGIH